MQGIAFSTFLRSFCLSRVIPSKGTLGKKISFRSDKLFFVVSKTWRPLAGSKLTSHYWQEDDPSFLEQGEALAFLDMSTVLLKEVDPTIQIFTNQRSRLLMTFPSPEFCSFCPVQFRNLRVCFFFFCSSDRLRKITELQYPSSLNVGQM